MLWWRVLGYISVSRSGEGNVGRGKGNVFIFGRQGSQLHFFATEKKQG